MKFILTTVALACFGLAGLAPSVPAQAQQPGTVTLFSEPGFSGTRFTINGRRETVTIHFRVRSVQVPEGEEWQLCTQTNLRNCTNIGESLRETSMIVRSAQPVSGATTSPGARRPSGRF